MSEEVLTPKPRAKPWRRWVRRIGLSCVALLCLSALAVLLMLTTSMGTRILLRQGVEFYSDTIPGDIDFERSEGSLGGGVTLHGLILTDASGTRLVEVERVRLGVDLGSLPARTIDVGTFEVEGAHVDIGGEFSDLGPPGPPAPEPPSPTVGPDLPVEIRGRLSLRSLRIHDGPTTLAQVHQIEALVWSAGTQATLQLQTSAALPDAGLGIHDFSLAAAWDSPALRVPTLFAQTSEGTVTVADTFVDFAAERFELGTLTAAVRTKHLAALVPGEPAGEASVLLEGGGGFDAVMLEAFVDAPFIGSAALLVEGGLGDMPWASVLLEAGLQEVVTDTGIRLPKLGVFLDGELEGDLDKGVEARVHASCRGCDRDVDPIELNATGRVSPAAAIVRLDADINAAALTLHADAVGSAAIGAGVAVSLRIPQLADFAPVLDRFAPGLGLAGSVSLDAHCGALVHPEFALCRVQAGIDDGTPIERIGLDVSAGVAGERIAALVHSLKIDRGQALVRMGPEPAAILYTPETLTARDVRARIGTNAGLGTLAFGGQLGLGEAKAVEASVQLSGLPLHSIAAFVPSLDLGGSLSADVNLAGTLHQPDLHASVRGRDLRYASTQIGELAVDARYLDEDLRVAVDVDKSELGTLTLKAELPVVIDVERNEYALLGRRRSSVSLSVRDARLETTRLANPKLASLEGLLDVTLEQRGSLARPKLELEGTLRKGAFQGHTLPEVSVRVLYAKRSVEATVLASHPEAFERISVSARAPLSLNLLRGSAALGNGEPLEADLEVRGANLAYARRLDPRLQTSGLVSVDAKLRGSAVEPTLDAIIRANALTWQEQPIGELAAELGYKTGTATARIWASGPEVSGLGIDATIPVALNLATQVAQWHPERPHELQVAINELLVRPMLAKVPGVPRLDLDARLHAVLSLRGSASQPTITVHTELEDVVYGGEKAGDVEIKGTLANSRANAEVLWTAPEGRTAWVSANTPVVLDLPNGGARWDETGPHHVRVSIPKLDPALVSPFVDVGDFDGAFAVHGVADGSLAAFNASLSARGVVRGPGKNLPLDARVVVTPDEQTVSLDLGSQIHVRAATHAAVVDLIGGGDWTTTVVEGTADIDALRLSDFSAFTPAELQNLRGRLDAHLEAKGQLGTPTFSGSLALADGAVTVVPARVRLTELAVASTFNNQGLQLDRLTFRAADGSTSATGLIQVVPNEGLRANVDLEVKKFPIRAPGLPRMALSTQVQAKAFANLDTLEVNVGVGKTLIDVYASSISAADPIPTNSRVVLADLSKATPVPLGADEQAEGSASPKHITIDFGEDIRIIGPSIDMRWAGNLETKVAGGNASTSGKLDAKKGSFSLLGNDFDLERGEVFLSEDGTAMPFLDVTATTSVEDVVINVAIRGPASRPEFELSSVPALPQSEIFTILVTGTADTQSADSEEVQDKAAAVLAAMSNGALQRQIGQKLRVDKVGVGFGDSSDQPILSVGKNVTKNVYAETEYHHNAPQGENTAQLEVEYEFAPRWSLQTFFGDAAEGGIAVFWGFAFDTKPKRKNPSPPVETAP